MRIRICRSEAAAASRAAMAKMGTVALIGFGEAGMAFAGAWHAPARAFDIKTDDPASYLANAEQSEAADQLG